MRIPMFRYCITRYRVSGKWGHKRQERWITSSLDYDAFKDEVEKEGWVINSYWLIPDEKQVAA